MSNLVLQQFASRAPCLVRSMSNQCHSVYSELEREDNDSNILNVNLNQNQNIKILNDMNQFKRTRAPFNCPTKMQITGELFFDGHHFEHANKLA